MSPPRLVPGERTSARLGARQGRARGRRPGAEFLLRIAARWTPRVASARPLLLRAVRWEGSPMLTGRATGMAGPWVGATAPDLVLPWSEPAEALAEVGTEAPWTVARPAPGGLPGAPVRTRGAGDPLAASGGASERQGSRRPETSAPVRSHWARRVLASRSPRVDGQAPERAERHGEASERAVPHGGGLPAAVPSGAASRRAGPSASRRVETADETAWGPATAGSADWAPLPAFQRLEQREHRPAGIIAGDLVGAGQPVHPASRGLSAARAALGQPPERSYQQASLSHHPARAVLGALARAGTPEDVVQTVSSPVITPASLATLPAPLAEVVQQIQQQATVLQAKSRRIASAGGRIAAVAGRRQQERSHPDPVAGLGHEAPTTGGTQGSAQVVSLATQRLIRRLQHLVHLAETDRRILEAQRRVRRAEDSAAARAEGSAPVGAAAAGGADLIDLDALGRDVLSAVNSVFQARTERRQEDPDVRNDVWW